MCSVETCGDELMETEGFRGSFRRNPITPSNSRIIHPPPYLFPPPCAICRARSRTSGSIFRSVLPIRKRGMRLPTEDFNRSRSDDGRGREKGQERGELEIEENERRRAKSKEARERADSPWRHRALLPRYFRRARALPAAIECTRESSHVVPYRPDTRGLLAKKTMSPVHRMGRDRMAECTFRELREAKT